jgi:hypothetical protein
MNEVPIPAIFSLARRRELEEERTKARRTAQARAKRVLAALTREARINQARTGIADTELAAAGATADSIEAPAAVQGEVALPDEHRDPIQPRPPGRRKRGKDREAQGDAP